MEAAVPEILSDQVHQNHLYGLSLLGIFLEIIFLPIIVFCLFQNPEHMLVRSHAKRDSMHILQQLSKLGDRPDGKLFHCVLFLFLDGFALGVRVYSEEYKDKQTD